MTDPALMQYEIGDIMKDHTCIELAGMTCITVLGIAGMIIDGDTGNAVAIACGGGLGAAVGYVYKAYKNGGNADEKEV